MTLPSISTLHIWIWGLQVRRGSRPSHSLALILVLRGARLQIPVSFSAIILLIQQLINALPSCLGLFPKLAISNAPYDMAEIDAQFQHHAVTGLARTQEKAKRTSTYTMIYMIPPRISKEPWAAMKMLVRCTQSFHFDFDTYLMQRERTTRPEYQSTKTPNLLTCQVQIEIYKEIELTKPNDPAIPLPQFKIRRQQARTQEDCSNDTNHEVRPGNTIVIWDLSAMVSTIHLTNRIIRTNP